MMVYLEAYMQYRWRDLIRYLLAPKHPVSRVNALLNALLNALSEINQRGAIHYRGEDRKSAEQTNLIHL